MNPSNKPPQGDNLSELEVVTSRHPQLTPDHPLEVLWDYYAGPETFYHGDVHYVLQLSIVRHGQIEIAYENHRRTCCSGDLWWTFCWEPHAFRCLDKRNLIMTVNVNLDDLGEIGLLGSSVNWLAPFSATPDKRYCPRTDDERDFIQKWADHMTHVYRRRPSNWTSTACFSTSSTVCRNTLERKRLRLTSASIWSAFAPRWNSSGHRLSRRI